MRFIGDPTISRGVRERRFDVTVDDEVVPGIVWTPEDASGPRPLVLIGHGGSQHKRSPNVLALARRLVRHLGYAAAAIDGPMHGDRIEDGHEQTLDSMRRRLDQVDPNVVAHRFRQAREEWRGTLDELRTLDEVGAGPVGYWGLSMGTVIGLPYVASESRIDAAVLGLMGIPADARASAAKSLRIPILFLIQWNDELVAPAQTLALFDAIGSKDKTAHINPGAHAAVPAFEIQASEDFFAKHLGSKVPAATG